MKQIIFLGALTVLFFSGCSSKENQPSYDVTPKTQQQNAEEALKDL